MVTRYQAFAGYGKNEKESDLSATGKAI